MRPESGVELRENRMEDQRGNLRDAIERAAAISPEAPVIFTERGDFLRYRDLCGQIELVRRELRTHGVSRDDHVAVVLPRSVDLAVSLLGVACAAPVAPLSAEHTVDEIRSYLTNLEARAVVTVSGSPGELAAEDLGILLLAVIPDPSRAPGLFRFATEGSCDDRDLSDLTGSDTCAVFLTSGTTSVPKRVPLTHGMVLARAQRTIDAFALTRSDRLLDPMPQTSAYSFVSALLPAILTGGSAMILDRFEPARFFRRAREFSATWSIAAPPHLEAMLLALDKQSDGFDPGTLRFIRCGTGHLREDVVDCLEARLGIPVAIGYGMVESGQIANSPGPPERRKPGSVGRPRMDIKLVDSEGRPVAEGERGEIMVRDPQVFTGYIDNPEATKDAFDGDWLRTGDLGYLDEDGFLFLIGRIKDIINRGGQSIAPTEIDDALLSHPSVVEAAAFALPHRTLQEDIGAAVTLKSETRTTERDLIEHLAARLSSTKIPRKIFIVSELPRTPNGKVSRRLLTARFRGGVTEGDSGEVAKAQCRAELIPDSPCAPPSTPAETCLARIWAEVLGLDEVGVHDEFMDLGGDSLTATQIISRAEEELNVQLSVRSVFEARTIAQLARPISHVPPVRTV